MIRDMAETAIDRIESIEGRGSPPYGGENGLSGNALDVAFDFSVCELNGTT